MSTELNNQPHVAPIDTTTPVPTDTTHQTPDAGPNGSQALLFGDNDIMGGITTLNKNLYSDVDLPSLELTGLISFAPPEETDQHFVINESTQPLPERPQPPTPQQISAMITNLNSDSYRVRERAQIDLRTAGPAALPQLLQAINNPPSLEVGQRSRLAVRTITERMTTDQLLALRDPAQRQQAIRDGLIAAPNAEQTQRLNTNLENAARTGLENKLSTPNWMDELSIGWKGKFDNWTRTPTEQTVTQYDRMATPEGRRQVAQRLTELTQILSSEHITNAERETITSQIGDIARVSSPANIANGRVFARTILADQLRQTGGDPNRISALMLEAHRLSQRPAPQAPAPGFKPERDIRAEVRYHIVNMGLDQNRAFMQSLQTQAGAAEVRAIQDIRTQFDDARRNNGK